ncbi:MAG: NUDIX hydrolase [Candidatus Dojkabacteria bacterium]|nr:NUDIX hydrolase [Candidatus Dojkabacteria bacterium]MDQ7021285.1 NUDIX hydrolase [Candidatus Dojkabacteria bacterium]
MSNYLDDIKGLQITTEALVLWKDKLLMQKRSSSAKHFPDSWSIPGGHVDIGEDLVTTARREVLEESAVDLKDYDLKLVGNFINYHSDKEKTWLVSVFFTRIIEFQDCIDTDEGETKWIDIAELTNFEIFPPIEHFLFDVLKDQSKIIYMVGKWRDKQLIEVLSKSLV